MAVSAAGGAWNRRRQSPRGMATALVAAASARAAQTMATQLHTRYAQMCCAQFATNY